MECQVSSDLDHGGVVVYALIIDLVLARFRVFPDDVGLYPCLALAVSKGVVNEMGLVSKAFERVHIWGFDPLVEAESLFENDVCDRF